MKLQVFTVVLLVMTPCNVVGGCQCFTATCHLHLQGACIKNIWVKVGTNTGVFTETEQHGKDSYKLKNPVMVTSVSDVLAFFIIMVLQEKTASCAEEIATMQGKDTMERQTMRSTEIMVNIQWGGLQVKHRKDEERSSRMLGRCGWSREHWDG
jgi:hypothetical protein